MVKNGREVSPAWYRLSAWQARIPQEVGAPRCRSPRCCAGVTTGIRHLLVEMSGFHIEPLRNELAGVDEFTVLPTSQAIKPTGRRLRGNGRGNL